MSGPSSNLLGHTARSLDMWFAAQGGYEEIKKRQTERMSALVSHARAYSPLYRHLYRHLPDSVSSVMSLPSVSKTGLMESFDDWVADRNVTLDKVSLFLKDRGRIGELFEDRYAVWKSSGTSGHPGIFLHDQRAIAIYDQLFAQRAWAVFPFGILKPGIWAREWRMACITACEDHFAGISSWRRLAQQQQLLKHLMRDLSILKPIDQLVEDLNAWQPLQIVAYPSVLALLAQEQKSGRLRLAPAAIFAGGECLDNCQQDLIEREFSCPVRCVYACSECDYIAFQCAQRSFHVNADWVILEPIDAENRLVDPGSPSQTVLITNLANYIQPIIRYELEDCVTLLPERCPCGNPLPAIRVEGRRDQVLQFHTRDGAAVTILPLAITTVLDLIPGLQRFQIVHEHNKMLRIACEFAKSCDETAVKREVIAALSRFLVESGLDDIEITVSATSPSVDPLSGKFHQVLSTADG